MSAGDGRWENPELQPERITPDLDTQYEALVGIRDQLLGVARSLERLVDVVQALQLRVDLLETPSQRYPDAMLTEGPRI